MRAGPALAALAALGCSVVVDIDGPPRPPEPSLATVSAPASLAEDTAPAPDVASACVGDVCLVPGLGLVARADGAPRGGPALAARVVTDGGAFYLAAGALERLALGGARQAIGGDGCTHVAWTGAVIVASCGEALARVEEDRLAPLAPLPFAAEGISLAALIGTGAGALAVGARESATEDGSVWVVPLDAHGRVSGQSRWVASSPFASEVVALGMRGRVLVAWPAFGDPFPRVVTHLAVLDRDGAEVVAPHAPLPRAAAGRVASDGETWLLAWTQPSDGMVRAVRVAWDGGLVPDVASEDGIRLGAFPFESVVGLDDGPHLLFGAGQRRTLRFVPTDS